MLIKSLCIPERNVVTLDEKVTLEEAIKTLEHTGYRCVPVLDESGKIFRGNIYKMHIYRHKSNGGDMSLPVTHLLKNATKYIHLDSSFFKIFFMIKDLPYISVLNEDNHFFGILTHSALLDMLQESWSIDTGSFVLTIASSGERGDLANISKTINKHCSIISCITLDVNPENRIRRTIMTLEPGVSHETLGLIREQLNKKGFSIVELEDLHNPRN